MTSAHANIAGSLVFGRYRLDNAQGVLFCDGSPVALVPKAISLLNHLLANAGRVVRKEELIAAVWPNSVVEEGNLAKLVFLLRKELGEATIETVPRRGYRVAVPVLAASDPETEIAAVMPLVSQQPGEVPEELCEGIAEEIIAAASALSNVRVVARSSSYRLAGEDVREVGARLSATLVVEGRIRKLPTGYRVSLQIVDARTGLERWTGIFNGPADNPAALQREISHAVVKWLGGSHGDRCVERAGSANSEAHYLYLQGRYHWNRRPGPAVFEARRCFDKAIQLDPNFAAAWSGVADVDATLGSWESGVLEPREAQRRARDSCLRALELAPGLSEAQTTLAYTALHFDWDIPGADRKFRRALKLNPNSAATHHWHSHCLVAAGKFEAALRASETALALDPMNVLMSVHLAWHHFMTRQPDGAVQQAERTIRMEPDYHWGHYFLGWGSEAQGETNRAVSAMRRAVACSGRDPVMIAGLARAEAAAGSRRAALQLLSELERDRNGRELFAYEEALIWLALQEKSRAMGALVRAVRERSGWIAYLDIDPRLDPLRADSCFQTLRNNRLQTVRAIQTVP